MSSTKAWPLAAAKARLSEIVDRAAAHGPQTITRHGRAAAVVVAAEEWSRRTRRRGTLADFFAASPLAGSDLRLERPRDRGRKPPL